MIKYLSDGLKMQFLDICKDCIDYIASYLCYRDLMVLTMAYPPLKLCKIINPERYNFRNVIVKRLKNYMGEHSRNFVCIMKQYDFIFSGLFLIGWIYDGFTDRKIDLRCPSDEHAEIACNFMRESSLYRWGSAWVTRYGRAALVEQKHRMIKDGIKKLSHIHIENGCPNNMKEFLKYQRVMFDGEKLYVESWNDIINWYDQNYWNKKFIDAEENI